MDHLIIIAFPDFYIQYHEVWHRVVWKFLGFTEGNTIRAGHNCAILVDGGDGSLQYYDFGRYDVPDGYGRARCRETDPQLALEVNAKLANGRITNLEDIMQHVYESDSIHHSAGPMFYKLLSDIDGDAVKSFVRQTQSRGFVDYDIFRSGALNCSRYISELVTSVVPKSRITTFLKWICPSPTPMDTVINVDADSPVIKYDGENSNKQHLTAWDGIKYYLRSRGAYYNDTTMVEMTDMQWIGSKAIGSYYHVSHGALSQEESSRFDLSKYSAKGIHLWDRQFSTESKAIDLTSPYRLELGKSPDEYVIIQNNVRYLLHRELNNVSSPALVG